MVFSSHIFVFYFLPVTLLIYYSLPRGKNAFLLVMSYIFYGWSNPWFVCLMFAATYVNYACGKVIARSEVGAAKRKTALVVSVVASLSMLGFFKYFMFVERNVNSVLNMFGLDAFPILEIYLPVGISFYIFQSLSYTIDVYRGDSPPVRSLSDFACFVALFPQLIAGPIVRYNTVAEQLVHRNHSLDKFASGIALFILGLAKKILLANQIGPAADTAFAAESLTACDAWFGVVAYALQIYFDFSAYSDMAIGLGRMIGFEFLKNFDAPYRSESITEFWRRWHISLSTFLRDYLYIPLGGNRHGERRTYINLAIVMLLGGLWHGANWTFVVWGAYHGALLAFERWRGKESIYSRLPKPCRIGVTFVLVLFSWVLFRSDTLADAMTYFTAMFGFSHATGASIFVGSLLYTRTHLVLMALCAVLALQSMQSYEWAEKITWLKATCLVVLFSVSLMTMSVQAFNPFLYFQF